MPESAPPAPSPPDTSPHDLSQVDLPEVEPPLAVLTDLDLPGDDAVEEILKSAGFRFRRAHCQSADDVVKAAQGAAALLVQWAPVTADVLEQLAHCRFISRLGIGYDMIDVDTATSHGIAVANTPDYCIEEVAAHTIAMILAIGRRLPGLDQSVRRGRWSAIKDGSAAIRPSSTTLAVLGFGRIGSLTASFAAGLGLHVVVHDPYVAPDTIRAAGHRPAGLDEALRLADILTLHVTLTPDTHHLLNRATIKKLKRGGLVVNTCRGGLIDETALADAVTSGHIAGAALDVFESEPLPTDSALRALPNVILTPHAAWLSPESLPELPRTAARNVVDFFTGRPVPSIVNPEFKD